MTGNKVEYLLMAMEFPTDQTFLDNPDVWIGDTGASVHMTPHRGGMHDVKRQSPSMQSQWEIAKVKMQQ
jgi:hypothetical protein